MQVVQVDERDSDWADRRPRFRVYLHGGRGPDQFTWTDTYDVSDADVLQVIDWAQRQAGDELVYAVALLVPDPAEPTREPGLVWLVGMDVMDATEQADEETLHVRARMLGRRQAPVGVPEADQAPADVASPYTDGTESRS